MFWITNQCSGGQDRDEDQNQSEDQNRDGGGRPGLSWQRSGRQQRIEQPATGYQCGPNHDSGQEQRADRWGSLVKYWTSHFESSHSAPQAQTARKDTDGNADS